jgi:hypothetical protein
MAATGRANMGGLIATRGTRRLIKHYNDIFSGGHNPPNIDTTRQRIFADGQLLQFFTNPGSLPIRDIIMHDQFFLPPDDQVNHKNLLKRWKYYLSIELQSQNQIDLTKYIAAVLNFPSGAAGPLGKNANGDRYKRIHFDCVQAAPGQNQIVVQSDEYRLKGANDEDDTGLLKNTAYSLIVLITDPIKNAPDPQDPQNIQ